MMKGQEDDKVKKISGGIQSKCENIKIYFCPVCRGTVGILFTATTLCYHTSSEEIVFMATG